MVRKRKSKDLFPTTLISTTLKSMASITTALNYVALVAIALNAFASHSHCIAVGDELIVMHDPSDRYHISDDDLVEKVRI